MAQIIMVQSDVSWGFFLKATNENLVFLKNLYEVFFVSGYSITV